MVTRQKRRPPKQWGWRRGAYVEPKPQSNPLDWSVQVEGTLSDSVIRYAPNEMVDFANRTHAPHDPALERAFVAPALTGLPAIQIGPSEGRLLELLVKLVQAKRVVEVGTLCGYSTIRMARALPPDGRLWSIELDTHHAEVARENIAQAGLASRVDVIVGPAADRLPDLTAQGPFDIVFIDADKENYPLYGRWAAANLRRGGLLIADNAYLFGCLLDDDPTAAQVRQFHNDTRDHFDSVCLSTPDGLVLGIRR